LTRKGEPQPPGSGIPSRFRRRNDERPGFCAKPHPDKRIVWLGDPHRDCQLESWREKEWCAEVLGWTFTASFPTPAGEYHLFAYSDQGGGGIRSTDAGEQPGSVPFIHVDDAQAAFTKAMAAGAEEIQPPERVADGVTVALVRAPGGVPIGFSGP
jgi:uncharacterized protein